MGLFLVVLTKGEPDSSKERSAGVKYVIQDRPVPLALVGAIGGYGSRMIVSLIGGRKGLKLCAQTKVSRLEWQQRMKGAVHAIQNTQKLAGF